MSSHDDDRSTEENGLDVGLRALGAVYSRLQVDDAWSVNEDRAFTWLGKDFGQRVSVTPPTDSRGFQVSKLIAETPVVEGVSVDGVSYERISAMNAYGTTLSALVLGVDGLVKLVTTATVHEETLGTVEATFSLAAAMQAADAQIKAGGLAELLKGRPAASCHPTSGIRTEMDDMLNIIERLVAPQGAERSQWVGPGMLEALGQMRRVCPLANGDEHGFVAEFPYRDFSMLLGFHTEEPHPQVGNGLHVTLKLPSNPSKYPAHVSAGFLNELEAAPGMLSDLQGAWCVSPSGDVSFTAFYPNVFSHAQRCVNIAAAMVARCQWVAKSGR